MTEYVIELMDVFNNFYVQYKDTIMDLSWKILMTFIYLFVGSIIIRIVKNRIKYIFGIKRKDPFTKKQETLIKLLQNIFKYVAWFVIVISILGLYGIETSAFLTSAGVLGVAIGFGSQDLVKDVIAGFFIIFEEQFSIGDIIEVDGFKGEAIDIGLKTTRIQSWTGEVKIVPNGNISNVINYTLSNSVAIVDVGISYETDISKMEDILIPRLNDLSKEIDNLLGEIQYLGVQALDDSAVVIRLIVETKAMQHFAIERKLRKEIKQLFDETDINIPYPQLVIHKGE